jgi:hypothetical protein
MSEIMDGVHAVNSTGVYESPSSYTLPDTFSPRGTGDMQAVHLHNLLTTCKERSLGVTEPRMKGQIPHAPNPRVLATYYAGCVARQIVVNK